MKHRCYNQLQRQDRTENRPHNVREVYRASKQASGMIRVVNTLGYTQSDDGDADRLQIVNGTLSLRTSVLPQSVRLMLMLMLL